MPAAALSYGCAGVFGRRFRALPLLTEACGQFTSSAALALPLTVLADRPWALLVPGAGAWAALLGRASLGERLDPPAWSGMALVGLGLVCRDGRALRRFARRPA